MYTIAYIFHPTKRKSDHSPTSSRTSNAKSGRLELIHANLRVPPKARFLTGGWNESLYCAGYYNLKVTRESEHDAADNAKQSELIRE
jgi:hypothetical protein